MAVIGSPSYNMALNKRLRFVLDANPYIPGGGGAQYYTNQVN
jgi:hypothetical protein